MTRHRRLEAAPLTRGEAYHKMSSTKLLVCGKTIMCMREGERTSLWTSPKIKQALFKGTSSCKSHSH